jgi:hypothetical protein
MGFVILRRLFGDSNNQLQSGLYAKYSSSSEDEYCHICRRCCWTETTCRCLWSRVIWGDFLLISCICILTLMVYFSIYMKVLLLRLGKFFINFYSRCILILKSFMLWIKFNGYLRRSSIIIVAISKLYLSLLEIFIYIYKWFTINFFIFLQA